MAVQSQLLRTGSCWGCRNDTPAQKRAYHEFSECVAATVALRFALPHKQQLLGLPAGQHVMVRVPKRGGGFLERPYNPTSTDAQPGIVEFLVKVRSLARPQPPTWHI